MRCVLLLALTAAAMGQEAKPVVPTLVLEDQFDMTHDLKSYRGSVVVLIYGDRHSAKANQQLGELIHVGFHPEAKGKPAAEARKAAVRGPGPDVLAVPVACIGKVPAFVGRVIKNQIKGGSPVVPVWLDFGEQMKGQFPFAAGVPNVVVIDVHGRYRYAAAGNATAEGTGRLMATIEGLRQEALAGK